MEEKELGPIGLRAADTQYLQYVSRYTRFTQFFIANSFSSFLLARPTFAHLFVGSFRVRFPGCSTWNSNFFTAPISEFQDKFDCALKIRRKNCDCYEISANVCKMFFFFLFSLTSLKLRTKRIRTFY